MNDRRGSVFFPVTSNRAPFYSDATIDGTLLATTLTKNISPVDAQGNPAICSKVTIINSSGKNASVTLLIAKDGQVITTDGIQPPQLETTVNAIVILSTDSPITIEGRIYQIIEKNIDSGTQTGRGMRYLFTLEPKVN